MRGENYLPTLAAQRSGEADVRNQSLSLSLSLSLCLSAVLNTMEDSNAAARTAPPPRRC